MRRRPNASEALGQDARHARAAGERAGVSASEPLALFSGWPGLLRHEAACRWVLVLLGVLWGLGATRWPARRTLLVGLLFAVAASGFWIATLARPYGLPFDVAVAREAASAVLAESRGRAGGLAPDAPFVGGLWARLALVGVPAGLLVNLPTLLPLVVLPGLALLTHARWRSRAAPLAAVLWLVGATDDLTMLRGAGFLPGLWTHPAAAMGVLACAGAAFGLTPASVRRSVLWLVASLAGALLAFHGPQAPLQARDALLLASVDQAAWWLVAAGSWRRWDGATRLLLGAGVLGLGAGACGAPIDAWGAQALLRLGLVLACARTLRAWQPLVGRALRARLAGALPSRMLSLSRTTPRGLALGLLIALAAPSSAHVWWRPYALDVSYPGSVATWPDGLRQAMDWVRAHTRREAVFVTSPEWAGALPILGGRRVLRAPGLVTTADDARRARLTYLALAGSGAQGWRQARRYRVTHAFVGPQDLRVWNLQSWDQVEANGRFRLRFEAHGFRVYELVHWSVGQVPDAR